MYLTRKIHTEISMILQRFSLELPPEYGHPWMSSRYGLGMGF
jgi:hypothetical protein